ncbi:MAG: hypothetical protein A3F87_03030 [Omnitrophica WOR_2 bacterium RIFCSPLOWO2_12_FULL_51_24]|nr:MAG: hypothetical protein A2879_05220 [Omnitrophica WOR_2 bacterium RIFCSPHIGHO2_01_FULL_49_10]OGX33282.1 MAG: hypothetical protein A3I43_06200 [Omnitrophica WOR_2 bacterium RIFCSPLOWO2_02_FULL_50_19]OGX42840.1 MAG: hypothetical protein A3F87_03030 [Omnitrophica WOR_2 bacterium RIFCSPLOWO2_12_FULL_51_24]
MKRTAVIFALYWELRPLARRLGINFFKSLSPVVLLGDRNILLARSGVGAERAERLAENIIKNFRPELVISAGFCGALVKDLKIGDVIVSDLKDRKLFCSPQPLFTCEEKTAAFQREGAIIVDMESDAVASAAKKYDIPFIAVKAVSDTLLDELPRSFLQLLSPPRLLRFKRNTGLASNNLAEFLFDYINPDFANAKSGINKGAA